MSEKWTDPLEKVIKQHRNISEYVMDFEKFSDFIHDPDSWKTQEFDDFLKKYFYNHFSLEEKKIFPVLVKKVGGSRLKELVQELYKDHEEMLSKVDRARSAVKKGKVDKETYMLVKEVLNQLLEHARREDDELIPLLQKNREIFSDL